MKNKLTIEQHAALGTAINTLLETLPLVWHSQNKNSSGYRAATKISRELKAMQSEMEGAGYADGLKHVATDFYYGLSPHHGVDSIEELVKINQ